MTYAERQLRNTILLNLADVEIGQKLKGKIVGLTQQSVSKICKDALLGVVPKRHLGAKARLSEQQVNKLPNFLSKGSEYYEFTGNYWTQQRVQQVIEKEFGVIFEVKQVGRILKKIGWTSQKPQKKDAKQDLEKVEKWQTEGLAMLKKKL